MSAKNKKIPGLFKKRYSEKKLDKKILKKIYIPDDKKYVKSLFKKTEPNEKGKVFFEIPKDTTFTKQEAARLKKLAKDIKKQKGRFKFAPFIAVVIFIAAIGIGITLTKNIIAKKVIISSVQKIAKARCDVKSVNIQFLDANFSVKGLEIANKDEPMKNLIQIDKINFDFNLTQLLKAKFVANDMSILGVEFGTDRTYDGTLPPKEAKKIKNKEDKPKEESEFVKNIKAKSANALDDLKLSINDMFTKYNPENYVKNIYSNLKSPQMAEEVQKQVEELITKYTKLSTDLQNELEEAQKVFNAAMAIDLEAALTNPLKLKEAIETITEASNFITKVQSDAESLFNGIQTDFNNVNTLSNNIQNAIKSDNKLISSEVSKITSFNINDSKKLVSNTIESAGYSLLGKYYPYVKEGSQYLSQLKLSSSKNKASDSKKEANQKKENKPQRKRLPGRNISFRGDNIPKLWIKNIAGSGGTMAFHLQNLSSDMDIVGKPMTGDFSIVAAGIEHSADLIVDTRKNTTAPLITADYSCGNLDISLPASKLGEIPGVPALDSSKGKLSCVLEIFEHDGFSISGNSLLTEAKLSAIPFEPKIISDIYLDVLSDINTLDFSFKSDFKESTGLNLDIYSEIDKQINAALTKEITKQLKLVKEQVQTEATKRINELTNGALGDISKFTDIKNAVKNSSNDSNALKKQIEARLKEATDISIPGSTPASKEDLQNKTKDFLKSLF